MAMFKDLGYCPNNAFCRRAIDAKEKLGDRTGYMVYEGTDQEYGTISSVLRCLSRKTELTDRICLYLNLVIPRCEYAKIGRKIRLHDVVSPYQCGEDIINLSTEKWSWGFTENGVANIYHPLLQKDSRIIFFDQTWFVLIDDHGGTYEDPVDIYFFYRRPVVDND